MRFSRRRDISMIHWWPLSLSRNASSGTERSAIAAESLVRTLWASSS